MPTLVDRKTIVDAELLLLDFARQKRQQREQEAQQSISHKPGMPLAEFVRSAWPILEPATTYRHNWHLDVLTSHLEAISRGELQDLLVNVPPGFSKSLTISVFWHAWEWTWLPWTRWLCCAYDARLATRDALKARRLIESDWYQERWGHVFKLTSDQNQKTRFENDRTGWRIASSVLGLATGEHASRRLWDDPHQVQAAESDLEREAVLTAWKETMTSRGIPTSPLNARVMVMQRVHERDVAADWLEREPHVHHICLPNEYEPPSSSSDRSITDQSVSTNGHVKGGDATDHATMLDRLSSAAGPICQVTGQPHDLRTHDGELLWPAMVDATETERLKTTKLGPYAYAGQYQQNPVPRAGLVIDPGHIRDTPAGLVLSACDLVMAWDLNYSSKDHSDWTVGLVAAVDRDPELPRIHLLDLFRDHLAEKDHAVEITSWIVLWKPILVGIERRAFEHQGATEDLIRLVTRKLDLAHVVTSIEPVDADTDKVSRAMVIPGRAKAGLVTADKRAAWWFHLSSELSHFPNGAHDDAVDCLAHLIRLTVEKLQTVRAMRSVLGQTSRVQYVDGSPPPTRDPKWDGLMAGMR